MLEQLGRRFARFTTNQVVRHPRLWPLFRWLTRAQFNRIAPAWDQRRTPEAFASLEAALDGVDVSPKRALDLGTGTGRAAFLVAQRYPEAEVVGVDLAEEILATFLATEFEGGRHARRIAEITDLEAQF